MKLKISEILGYVCGENLSDKDDTVITSCVIDSRQANPDSLFIPFEGENVNGYDYIKSAVSNGAKCVFIEDEAYYDENMDCSFILVEDNTKALQRLAKGYRDSLNLTVIGITGSNGKTTTKDLVSTITSQKGKSLKTRGNLNNHLGLPLSLLDCERDHEFAILEMGMSEFGEIDLLSKISRPNMGIITNIGESHIENLKTKENIAKAKGEIFNYMQEGGIAFLNGDDPYLLDMANYLSNVIFYGLSDKNHIYAENIRRYKDGMEFEVKGLGLAGTVKLPMFGEHNVYNCLSAMAVGAQLGLNLIEIQQGLLNLSVTGMRTEVVKLQEDVTIINDCYNASETSTKAALRVLEDLGEDSIKIAYLGDMLELGDYSHTAHYNVGQFAAQVGVQTIVTVGEQGEVIKQGAVQNGFSGEVFVFKSSLEAKNHIKEIIQPNSTVLIKGSRGLKMEILVEEIKEEF